MIPMANWLFFDILTRCLSGKGEVETLSEQRRLNLSLCEGDLKAARNSFTTLEEAHKALQETERSKKLFLLLSNIV